MKKDDQNTAGDGNDPNKDQNTGSENSNTADEDKNKQGQQSDDDKTDKSKPNSSKKSSEPEGNDDDDDLEDDDDDTGQKLEGDEKLVKISQAKLDQIVQRAKDKQKRSDEKRFNREIKNRDTKIQRLENEVDENRKLVAIQVQTEVDQLPEEVKKMVPASLDTASGLKKVQDWLPDAKALAARLGVVVKTTGNKPNPPPAGTAGNTKTPAEIAEEARNHPMYRSF